MTDRDRSDRIDLRAWIAPPMPADFTDRVVDEATRADASVTDGARSATVTASDESVATATAGQGEAAASRSVPAWPRYLAGAAAGAVLAAAATWWLIARPHAAAPTGGGTTVAVAATSTLDLGDGVTAIASPGALFRWQRVAGDAADPRVELHVTQTTGAVAYRSRGGTRLRISTPLAMIDADPEPVHLVVSPWPTQEDPMQHNRLVIGGVAAVLAGGVAIAVYEGQARVRPTDGATRTVAAGEQVALAPTTTTTIAKPTLVAHATRDRVLRDQVATAIAAAQARRAAQVGARAGAGTDAGLAMGPGTEAADASLPMKRDDIRQGVRETIPMLTDCYQLELLDRGVIADGQLIAHLTVESEPDLGTVVTVDDQQPTEVDFAAVTPGADMKDPKQAEALQSFTRCVELTLESVVLPPMASDGRLAITYPFIFASADGEDADSAAGGGSATPTGGGSGSGSAGSGNDSSRRDRDHTAGEGSRPRKDAAAPARLDPPPTPTPTPTPTPKTAAELLREANEAAVASQWAKALQLAEQALHGPIDAPNRSKAITIAGLAACNTTNRSKAHKYYDLSPPARQTLLRMACLKHGIELAL